MTLIQRPSSLADENYNFRLSIDSKLPDMSQEVLKCLQSNWSVNNSNSIFNNGIINNGNIAVDKNGVKPETSIFSSYKAIANLTPEQKKKLADCEKEIARINETKIKVAKEQEENEKNNKTNTKTLEKIFEENNLSTTGLSEELRNITDYDKIQEELEKALNNKQKEQESLKKEYFGEDAAPELDDIKIANIDKAESKYLSDLMKEQDKKYEKCAEITQKLKETENKMKAEIDSIIKTTTNMEERNNKIQNIQNKYRKDIASLTQQKVKAETALEKARLKVTEYGQKAAKDDKTIGIDGKEVKYNNTSATKTEKKSATITPILTADAIKTNEELSNEVMIESGYYNENSEMETKPSLLPGFNKIGSLTVPQDITEVIKKAEKTQAEDKKQGEIPYGFQKIFNYQDLA